MLRALSVLRATFGNATRHSQHTRTLCMRTRSSCEQWSSIDFQLSLDQVLLCEGAAKRRVDLANSFNTKVLSFDSFGADRLKAFKASPDAFAQVWLVKHRTALLSSLCSYPFRWPCRC